MLARFSPLGLHSHRTRRLTLGLLCALAAVSVPAAAMAHPLGNFTINHYAGIRVTPDTVRLDVVLDYAEIPAFQERGAMDADEDGEVSTEEAEAARAARCADLAPDATARGGGRRSSPCPSRQDWRSRRVSVGLRRCAWSASSWHPCLGRGRPDDGPIEDRSNAEQIGWRESSRTVTA